MRAAFRPWRRPLSAVMGLAVFNALIEAAIILFIASAGSMLTDGNRRIDRAIFGIDVGLSLNSVCLITGLLVVIRAVLDLAMVTIKARTETRFDAAMRRDVARGYLAADWALQSQEQAGGLQAAMTSFVSMARTLLTKVTDLVVAAASFAVMLIASLSVGGLATLAVVVLMAGLAYCMRPFIRANRASSLRQRDSTRSFSNRVTEMVTMAREVRLLGLRVPMEERLDSEIDALQGANFASSMASYRLQSLHATATYLAVALGLGALAFADVADPQPYAAMVLLLYRAMIYGRGIQSTYQGIAGALPYLEDLDAIRTRYTDAAETPGSKIVEPGSAIRFEQVGFSYDGEVPALVDLNLVIEPGEAIGVVGPSGAGKSTLVQLLLGLRPPTSGNVLLGSEKMAAVSVESRARHIAFVSQEPTLFDLSVIDNVICFRNHVSRSDAVEALRAASVLSDMEALPHGLDTRVGEGGRFLSGGQRQRVCIARALAGHPAVLVLDEPTSALDLASEDAIRLTLESIKGEMTLVVVAHRLSTLRACDKVLVIDAGRVEAFDDRATIESNNEFFAAAVELSKLV